MGSIGERFKEERLRMGMTVSALAEASGLAKSTISRYENDKRPMDTDFIIWLRDNGFDAQYVVFGSRSESVTETLYERPENALMAVVEIQGELDLVFSAEQIKTLLAYAYKCQAEPEEIKTFIAAAQAFSKLGVDIK